MTAQEIKALRLGLSWSVTRLAAEVGVAEVTVRHWEANLRKPGGSSVILLKQLRDQLHMGAKAHVGA